jgi:cytochrome c biogenesis protein CcmG/thiol:disulfide interchange protein DsbE
VKSLGPFLLLLSIILAGCSTTPHPRLIGSPAPDFTLKDSDRTVSLHDFRGKMVVLNFWTSWCPPCVEEMPSLVQLQKNMGSRLTVLAVSWDANESDYRNFLRQYNIDLLTVRDPQKKTWDLYGATGQPETYIIDASGTVRRKFWGPVDWNSPEITDYLSKL